jgi:hypothetical protein
MLRTVEGQMYGPVEKRDLDKWVTEGRVPATGHLRPEDSEEWQPAIGVYPSLATAAPFISAGDPSGSSNPYLSPTSAGGAIGSPYARPHRGGLILGLGIVGVVICGPLGIPAWIMGSGDLKEMRAGRMDYSGYGITQAGMILGIIATVLLGLGLLMGFAMVAFGIMAH